MSSDVHLRFLLGSCQQLMIDDQLWSSSWDYDIFSLKIGSGKKRNYYKMQQHLVAIILFFCSH